MEFNISPYYDDFEETKQFYKILFRPGVAVQTREVNQLQSILQNQVTKLGDHLFKEGSMVIPGQVNYNAKLKYLKVASVSLGALSLTDLEDQFIADNSAGTGVIAQVLKAIPATDTDPITLVLLYTQGNQTPDGLATDVEFIANATLYVVGSQGTQTIAVAGGIVSGRSVAAGLQAGVYYLADHFVTVESSILSVKKYADVVSDISARIGIQYTETVITANDDDSLYDNAAGSPNFAAPGAHRYKITTEFVQVGLDENPTNFFELMRIEEGTLQSIVNASQYNILEETLARRTFDESGNYVVDDFKFNIREARNSDRDYWSPGAVYNISDNVRSAAGNYFTCLVGGTAGTTEPANFAALDESILISETSGPVKWRYTKNPVSNRGLNLNGSTSNLVATFGIGKAYVQGYEISKLTNSNITIPKARDVIASNNQSIPVSQGNYVFLDRRFVAGIPDISTGPQVQLFDRFYYKGSGNKFGMGNQVGSARIGWVEPDGRGFIKVGLNNIVMNAGKGFDRDVNSIVAPDPTTSIAVTSYTLTSFIKYAGNTTSSYLQVSGLAQTTSQGSVAMTITSNLTTAYDREIFVGDSITFGSAAHAATCSWTVTNIISSSTMVLNGPPITLAAGATTAIFVRFAAQTVFGHATGISTRFQSEYRVGDTIWLGTPTGSSTATSMVVTRIINENRMLVSSAMAVITAQTSHGTYYANRSALFAGDVGDDYALGINARKLTGLYQLQDYSGGTTLVQAHGALRITGTNDARLLSEVTTNDFIDINNNKLLVTKISSNTIAYAIALEGTVTGSNTQFPAFRVNNNIVDAGKGSLLFKIAPSAVKSIADNSFVVYKTASVTGISGANQITVPLAPGSGTDAAEAIATTDTNAFYVAQNGVSTLSGPITVNSITVSANSVTLGINGTFSSNTASVIYPVTRAASANNVLGRQKSKTLKLANPAWNGIPEGYDDFLTSSSVAKTRLVLSKTDIYRTVKILMATGFVASWDQTTQTNATDITNRYQTDNGQRDYFYDNGAVQLITGFPAPTGSVRVYYDYFEHGAGDFFTLNSYTAAAPAGAGLNYENIYEYNKINLGDVLDFRARVSSVSTGLLAGAAPPRFGTNFIADIEYYLGRKEKIFLDRAGIFYNVSGVSDLVPNLPQTANSDNAIELYDIELSPYTISSDFPNVKQTKYDNRRYTMKDIGGIEKRVANLEQTTALSLLETKTSALQIRDNRDSTLERYKTGFFVDNFSDDSNSERGGDARFGIDPTNRTLNCHVLYNSFPLVEKLNYLETSVTTTVARAAEKYAITGDLLTLSYTTSTVLQQNLATTSIAVAPFITATFLGSMRVVPDKDIYEDVRTKTAIVGTATNLTPEAMAAAVAATRAWWGGPVAIETANINVFRDTTKTQFLIPFCRANTVLMIGKGLKPNTKFYPYFDDAPIARFCNPALKFTFSTLPFIDFEGTSPKGKPMFARWRSLNTSLDVAEITRARYNEIVKNSYGWVYDYGWFHRTSRPAAVEQSLPSAANRDAYRLALGIGTGVYYHEGGKCVGTGVGVYQEGNTLYVVNGRGKLAPSFLRTQPQGQYNYSGIWYIGLENNDPKILPTQQVTAAQAICSDDAGNVYTNASGVAITLFDLPDTDTVKFTTGQKPVTFTDHPDNDPDDWTSKADGLYTAEGYDVTFTKNYISTKTYVARAYDPIAQSFILPTQYENGAFITDIDVYFQAKPVLEQSTVTLELRSCDSTGRPSGTEMVPGSEVTLRPEQVTIDATKGQIPTKFTFRQPLYLMPQKQYAFVLRTDTKNYRVWMATMGQPDVNDPTKSYTTQALFGSLFKSQDGTIWTEDQTSDLKFKINRAVFNTADTGADVYVVNTNLENAQLPNNPLTFIQGSNKIRVSQRSHGFSSGDTTRLYSKYWADQFALLGVNARIAGIPVGEIFGAYVSSDTTTFLPDNAAEANQPRLTISDVTTDTFTIAVSSVANIAGGTTGFTTITGGGEDIYGQRNVLYHVVNPSASIMKFQPTTLTLSGRMVRGFTYDTDANSRTGQYTSFVQDLNINDYNLLDTSCVILTDTVEFDKLTPTSITTNGISENWTDSFIGTFHLQTTNNAVSPAVDMSTLYLGTMQQRIDNPTYASRLPVVIPETPGVGANPFVLMTPIVTNSTAITFDGVAERITSAIDGAFSDVIPGRYITVSGSSISSNNNTSTALLVLSVTPDGRSITVSANLTTTAVSDSITIRQIDDYTEETTTLSASGESKYITKIINLQNPATQIKLQLEACVPSAADFDLYYKTGAAGADFNTVVWTKYIAPNQVGTTSSYTDIVKSDKRKVFTDIDFDISGYDSTGSSVDITPFTALQIKIVMRSSNAARIPVFRNMRVIAHA